MVNINQLASAAYGATQRLPTIPGPAATGQGQAPSFADLVESGIDRVISSQHKAEQLSLAAVSGKADVNDVIFAAQDASVMLETVVAFRDKIVQAYLDVLRMAI